MAYHVAHRQSHERQTQDNFLFQLNLFCYSEVASSFDNTPSFLWAIVGVAGFVVLAGLVVLIISGVTRHRQRKREEGLYRNLIAEDGDRGLNYTA